MSETLIKVEGVSKKFCRSLKKSLWYGVQDLIGEIRGRRNGGNGQLRPEEFWAVKDVSFEVKRGECLGLIGHNGAGKTTLLRMLNGLIKPDEGSIQMRGRTSALIALGAGFNPILTGRENIYVNAAVLGFSRREIDSKIKMIIDFAEIGEFIDMPVQSYSSGMAVRLGFSIASTLEPDVLILDEVLAVGDVGFRTKCYNRVYDLARNTAVVFVSHAMPQIARLATKAMLMSSGSVIFSGDVTPAIEAYESILMKKNAGRWQIGDGVTLDYILINGVSDYEIPFVSGDSLDCQIRIKLPAKTGQLETSISVHQLSLDLISHDNSSHTDFEMNADSDNEFLKINIKIPSLNLSGGRKYITILIRQKNTNKMLLWASTAWVLNVSCPFYVPAPCYNKAIFSVSH